MLYFDFLPPSIIYLLYNVLLFVMLFIIFKFSDFVKTYEKPLLIFILALLIYSHFIRYIHPMLIGTFSYQEHLPFHICRLSGFLLIYTLLFRKTVLIPYVFYLVGTGIWGVFIPNGGIENIPNLNEYFFIDHIIFALTPFYLMSVRQYRPSYKPTYQIPLVIFFIMILFWPINQWLDAGYFHYRDIFIAQRIIPGITPWLFVVLFNVAIFIFLNIYYLLAYIYYEKTQILHDKTYLKEKTL